MIVDLVRIGFKIVRMRGRDCIGENIEFQSYSLEVDEDYIVIQWLCLVWIQVFVFGLRLIKLRVDFFDGFGDIDVVQVLS